MKKLMILAAVAALSGVASAVEVYDYRSSVKHTYIRERAMTVAGARQTVYVKYTKNATLNGFVIQDCNWGAGEDGILDAASGGTATISSVDRQPGNRCFLVVMNRSAETQVRFPRIIPGILEAKWYNPSAWSATPASVAAQGIIYFGGEMSCAAPDTALLGTTFNAAGMVDGIAYTPRQIGGEWARRGVWGPAGTWTVADRNQAYQTAGTNLAIDDYWFTSCYLFGLYNQPEWNGGTLVEFSDAWMNLAGLGRARFFNNIQNCCGQASGAAGIVLENLTGSVKAGFYLCSEVGEDAAHALGVMRTYLFEDQLWLTGEENNAEVPLAPFWNEVYAKSGFGLAVLDLWTDGNLETRSTDVGYGTFTLRRTTRLAPQALTPAEVATLATAAWGANPAPAGNLLTLITAIKGAMLQLDRSATLLGNPVDISARALMNPSFYNNYIQ